MSGSGGVGGTPGSGGTGTLGERCAPNGALACAGHAQGAQLICDGGTWKANGTCRVGEKCDTSAGCQGLCAPILPACAGKVPGASYCEGQGVEQCGPDLVTAEEVESCAGQACVNGACVGSCEPGTLRCNGAAPQQCDGTGTWRDAAPCPAGTAYCSAGLCQACTGSTRDCDGEPSNGCEVNLNDPSACGSNCSNRKACRIGEVCTSGACVAPSCATSGPGKSDCGPNSESRCTSLLVQGGETTTLASGTTATVSSYRLDKYEVTVGRFRAFVDGWVGNWCPAAGAGKHTHLNGGAGLVNSGAGGRLRAGVGHVMEQPVAGGQDDVGQHAHFQLRRFHVFDVDTERQ